MATVNVYWKPESVFDTPLALSDGQYRAWLSDVGATSLSHSGSNICAMVAFAPKLRRFFLAGLDPYETVRRMNKPPRQQRLTSEHLTRTSEHSLNK